MDMANRLDAAGLGNESRESAPAILQDARSFETPDPEPGWVTRHPDRALAFFYVSPRPCSAFDELMSLGH